MRAALVERNWRDGFLYDFYWLKDGPFEAIAIYNNEEHDDGLFFFAGPLAGQFPAVQGHRLRAVANERCDD